MAGIEDLCQPAALVVDREGRSIWGRIPANPGRRKNTKAPLDGDYAVGRACIIYLLLLLVAGFASQAFHLIFQSKLFLLQPPDLYVV